MNQRNRVGVVMRSFARTPEKTAETAERVMKALTEIAWYRGPNWTVSKILVMIPIDRRYKDSDSGQLGEEIRRRWIEWLDSIDEGGHAPTPQASVRVIEFSGDLFVASQNIASHIMLKSNVDTMMTLAPSAARYFDRETALAVMQAFACGAQVAGIAIPEDGIDEFVHRGTLGGPIAAWDLKSLMEAGGFDQAAAQSKIGEENPNAGCEEIHPLIRIIKRYGPCYAPIDTRAIAEKRKLEGDDLARHTKQIATKTERQLAHARSLGIHDLEFFAQAVMPGYRTR